MLKSANCEAKFDDTTSGTYIRAHNCQPHYECPASGHGLSSTNPLLARFNRSVILDQRPRRIPPICCKPNTKDLSARERDLALCTNWRESGGRRGGNINHNNLWKHGPPWLSYPAQWLAQGTLELTRESQAEAQVVREIFKVAIVKEDVLDQLLQKHSLTKIQRAQNTVKDDQQFHVDREQLNLQENNVGILECRGRIIGEYPVYIPDIHPFATSLVREAHITTVHGGVGLTMAKVRERYWIPQLRRLVKKIRSDCNGCKRFRAKAYQAPPPGNLPTTRTQGTVPFEVIGVDFAGPIKYVTKSREEAKSYLALYA